MSHEGKREVVPIEVGVESIVQQSGLPSNAQIALKISLKLIPSVLWSNSAKCLVRCPSTCPFRDGDFVFRVEDAYATRSWSRSVTCKRNNVRASCDVMRCSIEGSPLRDVGDAARAARRPSVSHLHLVVVVVWEEGVFLSLQTR